MERSVDHLKKGSSRLLILKIGNLFFTNEILHLYFITVFTNHWVIICHYTLI